MKTLLWLHELHLYGSVVLLAHIEDQSAALLQVGRWCCSMHLTQALSLVLSTSLIMHGPPLSMATFVLSQAPIT